jgi:hypothetical protein
MIALILSRAQARRRCCPRIAACTNWRFTPALKAGNWCARCCPCVHPAMAPKLNAPHAQRALRISALTRDISEIVAEAETPLRQRLTGTPGRPPSTSAVLIDAVLAGTGEKQQGRH